MQVRPRRPSAAGFDILENALAALLRYHLYLASTFLLCLQDNMREANRQAARTELVHRGGLLSS
jgi:hypothetical protein